MPRKIVYHGTYSEKPPHLYKQPTFHVGTAGAAVSRLNNVSEGWGTARGGVPAYSTGTIHAYEVAEDAPTSRKVWGDPVENDAAPENNTKRIYRYTNTVERWDDDVSESMVIPTKFVGKHVKYLGAQFTGYTPPNPWWKEEEE